MKKFGFSAFLCTALLLLLAGCGKKKETSVISPDFFSGSVKGEITVSAYDSMLYRNFLESAAKLFEERYPGTKINVETFSAMPEVRSGGQGGVQMTMIQAQNDPQGRSDYISRVNTNLMSGTGADMYAMDILPLHKFSAGGSLENLEPYMELDPEFHQDDYRRNILDALRYNNGTWFLPLDYTFNYFSYDTTLIPAQAAQGFSLEKAWTIEELLRTGTPLYDGAVKLFNIYGYDRRSGGMFRYLLNENIQYFVQPENKKAHFTDGKFSAFLESVKKYGEEGLVPMGITGQQDAGQIMQRAATGNWDRFFFKLNNNFSLFGHFIRRTGVMQKTMSEGTTPGIEDDDEIAGIEADAGGSVPFKYNQAFGINSQSKNKALAWAFLKFLLSEPAELQMSAGLNAMGLPLNNKEREKKAELVFSNIPQPLNGQQKQALEDYKTAVETLSDSINSFVVQDTGLNDMIFLEADYFFNGSRSAEETARVLQNKADLYLSE